MERIQRQTTLTYIEVFTLRFYRFLQEQRSMNQRLLQLVLRERSIVCIHEFI